MTIVCLLTHEYVKPSAEEEVKWIGSWSTREKAEAFAERLLGKPGFRRYPGNFRIREIVVDQDHWTDGFGLTSGLFFDEPGNSLRFE